jgi:hypothetical protein
MKTIAAFIAGLLLSGVTFILGILFAVMYLPASEQASLSHSGDVSGLWTSKPTIVDAAHERLKRVAAKMPDPPTNEIQRNSDITSENPLAMSTGQNNVDPTTTSATIDSAQENLKQFHTEWCKRRYSSYRVDDDSYQPYRGIRRQCASPYIVAGNITPASTAVIERTSLVTRDDQDEQKTASAEETVGPQDADAQQAMKCARRYRSYRPEDNTYQPFDGGPRRQCF